MWMSAEVEAAAAAVAVAGLQRRGPRWPSVVNKQNQVPESLDGADFGGRGPWYVILYPGPVQPPPLPPPPHHPPSSELFLFNVKSEQEREMDTEKEKRRKSSFCLRSSKKSSLFFHWCFRKHFILAPISLRQTPFSLIGWFSLSLWKLREKIYGQRLWRFSKFSWKYLTKSK